MGVFALFSRKKKDAAAASPEEAGAVAPEEAGDTEAGTDAPEAVADAAKAGSEVETASGDVDDVDAGEAATGAVAAEVVEIPKQQSAEAAADNEAGEGARK
ncbi:hypothetical protein [Streptomyces sp. NBC_00572]|uniref:hypothetical protein n=1 Tax=Streptomyces sp. NBC_00572 TaxID=2903664 RepID=UPI002252B1F7|nr:hypothetical protein [Streptomyces sp. NBC_00572]MCX4983914.1 hypothetical protein [Streptomyces sp. NBC_00572]